MSKFLQLSGSAIQAELHIDEPVIQDVPEIKHDSSNLAVIEALTNNLITINAQRDSWEQIAFEYAQNMGYYMGLLDQIAETLGPEAFTADDGGLHDSPIRAKLPEMIAELVRKQHEH